VRRIDVGGASPFTVTVGRGALQELRVPQRRRVLVYDTGLPYDLVASVQAALQPELMLPVPSGEACKTLGVYAELQSRLAASALPRDAAVVALGGGATTDLGGFLAGTYLRGVAFYAVPTTLLAQVDAAVGGKTGVNLPEGKNLVGVFWPPRAVWCDVDTLASLPPQVFREGAAEAFKHGLLRDGALCEAILSSTFGPAAEHLDAVVADAIQVKADVVTRDLREQGERAFLNFGHTLAHALEAVTRHGVSHGDAVGYGMHYAALVSRALGGDDLTALTARFLTYQRPSPLPDLAWEDVWPFMLRDKKADSVGLRFVLLKGLGRPYLARVPEDVLREVFGAWRAEVTGILAAS